MNFLSSLFAGGAANVIDAVGNAVDKVFTSDEQRISLENEIRRAEMSHKAEMKSLDIKETGLFLGDIDSARDNQSRVQESENASWMSKNIQPILAVGLILLCFCMFGKILFSGISSNPNESNIIMMILGGLLGVMGQVVSYFFGASRDTGEHTKKITDIITRPQNK